MNLRACFIVINTMREHTGRVLLVYLLDATFQSNRNSELEYQLPACIGEHIYCDNFKNISNGNTWRSKERNHQANERDIQNMYVGVITL